MRKILNRLIIVTITLLLSLGLALFGHGPLLVQAAGTITLSPTSGPPGSTVTVTGVSFNASETITITYDSTSTLASSISSGTGNWSTPVTIPPSVIGAHSIIASGSISGAAGNQTFTVTPGVTVSPTAGVVGSAVTINGAGFASGETGITINFDGTSVGSGVADVKGTWNSSFNVPAAASGSKTITVTGPTSGSLTTSFSVSPNISLNRASAAPGVAITVTGTGFSASETGIKVTYDNVEIATTPATVSANARGGWTATFLVPASPAGAHVVDAYGSSTSVNNVPNLNFTTSAGISVNKATGAPGTSITINGVGFSASETGITITFDDKTLASSVTANAQGGWTVNFQVPALPSGAHTIDAGSVTTLATTINDVSFTITPGFSLGRASAPPGTSVTLTGAGFGQNEQNIAITFDGAPLTVAPVTADSNGGWKAALVVPTSPAGAHTIGASGPSSTTVPAVTFTVTASISINPPNAVPGSSVTITGTGFNANETGIIVNYDNKAVAQGITANAQGGWTTSFRVPVSAAGSHSITAQGSVTPLTTFGGGTGAGVNIEAGILLDPASSYVGGDVLISGSGFAANSAVKISYDGKDIPSVSTATDASGTFGISVKIPQSIHGPHSVKVTDEQNNSKTATFTMESDAPAAPSLLTPGDGARLGLTGDVTPTLKWSSVSDPSTVTYHVQIDTDPDFPHPLLDRFNISSARYALTSSESLPRGSYYWRVRAIDGASNSSQWSQVWLLKSGLMPMSTLIIIIILLVGAVGGAVYFFLIRRKPSRGWEGAPAAVPEVSEAPRPIAAQWRLIEPSEATGERNLPYRLALPQAAKEEKRLSTEDMARLKVIVDFAQSLPLVEPGYTSKWVLDLAQTSLGVEPSVEVYKQLLGNELQIRYEPAWMRHPIFHDLSTLLEGQPILEDLNAFVDAVNRCSAEATLLLQQINGEATAENPEGFLEKGGWEFISSVYSDAIRWFLGRSLRDASERDYVLKRPSEGTGPVELWGEEHTAFAECLIRAADEPEALKYRALHLKLRKAYRASDTVKQLVDMMTQMAVQRDRLSSAFAQFDNFTR